MYPTEVLDSARAELLAVAEQMTAANAVVPVSGVRMNIPVGDHEVECVYYPSGAPGTPLILGFHGGGYLFGGCALNDAMWAAVGRALDAAVLSVGYRKSPQFRYMDAIEDAYGTAVYAREHAEELGVDPSRIALMGCSAGAGLAASTCIYAKQQGNMLFEKQILMYPFLDCATDPDSKGEYGFGPAMYIFNELHCTPEEARTGLASPLLARDSELVGLPPAVFCYADFDSLKAEGIDYAQRLRSLGVVCDEMVAANMPHGFFENGFDEKTDEELAFMSDEAVEQIKSGAVAKASQNCLDFIKAHF